MQDLINAKRSRFTRLLFVMVIFHSLLGQPPESNGKPFCQA